MRFVCLSIMTAALLLGGCSLDRVTHDSSYAARDDASAAMRWVIDSPPDTQTIRVRYHPLAGTIGCPAVEGRLDGSKPYPVVLDTGAAGAVFVNDIHIRENALPVFETPAGGDRATLCQLHRVRIEGMELQQPRCWYVRPRAEQTTLRTAWPAPAASLSEDAGNHLPFAADRSVIIGLTALRELSYLLVDDARQEVELSLRQSFSPAQPEHWSRYPLVVREDAHGYPSLFVDLSVAGQSLRLQLDTGSAKGLAVTERLWRQLEPEFSQASLRQGTALYPYIGRLPCRYGVLNGLQIGTRTLKESELLVFPDDSLLLAGCETLIGMGCFRDTVVVLDFQRGTLWVRDAAAEAR